MPSEIKRRNYGRGHGYTINGEKVQGVTTLLGNGLPKPALMNWAANVTAEYAVDHWAELTAMPMSKRLEKLKRARYDERDAAANRGTAVHTLAEKLASGQQVDVPEELAGHVESYVRFLDEWDPEPLLIEGVVAHRAQRYCGTLDMVARMAGAVWLLDIKTSRSGIFPDMALQQALYRHAEVYVGPDGAEHAMSELGIERSAAIHVRADGYDVVPLDTSERVFKDALHVLWIARMQDRMDEWRGEALTPPRRTEATA